ncbi:Nudix family hydrolase [Salinisphaera sp.]|uniref:Nudix family hydrolase n=2 Tax=Salinisphaera sp. TaxID=1914330 RepID=UPI000C44B7C8|nr:Nudix family hydrolase [Salinisphaera sp.]MAS11068.1 DNA mismatch repair protein MutT [Salinisphaera sp.]
MDSEQAERPPIDIAVGILVDARQRLLIAQRRPGTPGAGFWEFPGGKREGDEPMADCLARELGEEIGVRDCVARPLIRFSHSKGERPVRLHVSRIDDWQGDVAGLEGQQLAWVSREALRDYRLLPATDVILNAFDLPARYAITPAHSATDTDSWWRSFRTLLSSGSMMLRLRDQGLDDAAYERLAADVVEAAHAHGVRVLVDRSVDLCRAVGADGLHWPVARLIDKGRPDDLDPAGLVAVSAHTHSDLAMAARRGADFAVLSPVAATTTHPGAAPLGWDGWAAARADHALPVYALGGLGPDDMATAQRHNGQGVAAIRGFWPAG